MGHQHNTLAAGRWYTFSLSEQMGNIGSEVGRMNNAREDEARFWAATTRAFELLDLTISDPRWRTRLKEIVRVRELLSDAIFGGIAYGSSLEKMDDYFLQFAVAARAHR